MKIKKLAEVGFIFDCDKPAYQTLTVSIRTSEFLLLCRFPHLTNDRYRIANLDGRISPLGTEVAFTQKKGMSAIPTISGMQNQSHIPDIQSTNAISLARLD